MSKEIDLIKCIIFEIDKNLYSDFGGNLCISYTPDLKKLLLALNTPEVKYYFNNQDKQIADLQYRLEVAEKALENVCKRLQDYYCTTCDNQANCSRVEMCEMSLSIYLPSDFKEQAEKEVKGE